MEKHVELSQEGVRYSSGDEIDLFELWNSLLEEKLTVFWSFLIVIGLGTIYAFSVAPVYKATSYLLPPQQEAVLAMNELGVLSSGNVTTYSRKSVFGMFKTNLESRQNLKNFFNQYELIKLYNPDYERLSQIEKIKSDKNAFDRFIKNFSVSSFNKRSELDGFSVSLALSLSEEEVAKILNNLVKMAKQETIHQIYSQIRSEKIYKERQLEEKINAARQVELHNRLDKLVQLNEAIAITQSLNIQKPISKGPSLNINNVNREGSQNFPLYMLGSDLLMAEKKVLEARKNDDPFIENLRAWQQDLQQLESLKIDKEKFGVVRIDAEATYADKVKPKKALILVVSGVLGLMLGVFIALIRRTIKNRKAMLATS